MLEPLRLVRSETLENDLILSVHFISQICFLLQPEPMETDAEEKPNKEAKEETGEEGKEEEERGEEKKSGEEGEKDKEEKTAEVMDWVGNL